jgi:hypothetical protein
MRRTLLLLFAILLICWAISSTRSRPEPAPLSPSRTPLATTALPTASFTPLPTPPPTVTQSPTLTLTPSASPTAEATVTFTATPQPGPVQATVLVHPDGGLYAGDQVSLEVIVAPQEKTRDSTSQVLVNGPDGSRLGSAGFGPYGLGQRQEAILLWAWDTRGLSAGDYPLTFTLEPGGQVWTETVTLLPQDALPWPEPQAHWATAHSRCCTLYYITGTAAERDMPDLLRQADDQARDAVQRMGTEFTTPITITLLSRVLGHGGFASQGITITYLDRNYASSDFGLVLHHEMIHILDGRLGGEYRPSLLVEGLAVYQSGGHFKPEPLMPRAAVLLPTETGLGWYIPLSELADNFYLSQHEIGYLEGAALIEYIVETWGWEAFSSFYRDIHPAEDNSPATAIDTALQRHFQLTFAEVEAKFMDALRRIPVTTVLRDDLRLTVKFFDTARRYQQILDPSAYYATAWLVDAGAMRSRGIVADYLRHPAGTTHQAIETMLVSAFADLQQGQYDQVDQMLSAVNAVLDAVQRGDSQPFDGNAQAADYFAIVQALSQAGYETQRIELGGDSAQAWGTAGSAELVDFSLERGDAGWKIVINNGDLRWALPPQIPIFESWLYLNP